MRKITRLMLMLIMISATSFSQNANPKNLAAAKAKKGIVLKSAKKMALKTTALKLDGSNDQIINDNVFLQGQFVEVGVSACGCFGTTESAPEGYHANQGGLGFVADPAKDGWDVGDPLYNGDYFLPGSPEEGFGVEIDGSNYGNFSQCDANDIPMTSVSKEYSCNKHIAIWNGEINGLKIKQTAKFADNGTYFTIKAELTNTTAGVLNNVYYLRNVDPDNEQPWSGSYTTINTIVLQPFSDANKRALVSAEGEAYGMFLGYAAMDTRARVTYGGFSNRSASDVWNGINEFSQSGTYTGDIAISIAFNLGNIAAGETKTVEYAYILDASQVDAAFAELSHITANGHDISDPLFFKLCALAPIDLEIQNGSAYDTWTWTPSTNLSASVGTHVVFTPPATGTYFYDAVGSNTCGESVNYHFSLEIATGDATAPTLISSPEDQISPTNVLMDYTSQVVATDNCASVCTITQSPVPGTKISGTVAVTFTITDGASNSISAGMNVTYDGPVTPIAIAATNILSYTAYANWEAEASATSYAIDVSTSSSFYTFASGYNNYDMGEASTTFLLTNLASSTTFYYRIRSVNANGVSSSSNVISFTTLPGTIPEAPVATSANYGQGWGEVGAYWDATGGASSYLLDVSTSPTFGSFLDGWYYYYQLNVGKSTEYWYGGNDETNPTYYRVYAKNSAGISPPSNVITVKGFPVITFSNPADITVGTALGETQLNATAVIAGTWTYSPTSGTILDLGESQQISVTFTPDDADNYEIVGSSAYINVVEGPPTHVQVVKNDTPNIWPIPATTYIDLRNSQGVYNIRITNLTGKEVWNGTSLDFPLNIMNWAKGVYFITLEKNKTVVVEKILKQ